MVIQYAIIDPAIIRMLNYFEVKNWLLKILAYIFGLWAVVITILLPQTSLLCSMLSQGLSKCDIISTFRKSVIGGVITIQIITKMGVVLSDLKAEQDRMKIERARAKAEQDRIKEEYDRKKAEQDRKYIMNELEQMKKQRQLMMAWMAEQKGDAKTVDDFRNKILDEQKKVIEKEITSSFEKSLHATLSKLDVSYRYDPWIMQQQFDKVSSSTDGSI